MPCVLPRPASRCTMLLCVGADVVCLCLWVSSDGVFSLCLLSAIGRVLARLCRAVHGLDGSVAGPGRAVAGPVLFRCVG